MTCLFCNMERSRVLAENDFAYVIKDGFPITEEHRLIIPKRHTSDYFDLSQSEVIAVNQLLVHQKCFVQSADPLVTGFNIGVNCGEDAGQTIFHCHIHLIPRRRGDVDEPRGGVRHLIPGKGNY